MRLLLSATLTAVLSLSSALIASRSQHSLQVRNLSHTVPSLDPRDIFLEQTFTLHSRDASPQQRRAQGRAACHRRREARLEGGAAAGAIAGSVVGGPAGGVIGASLGAGFAASGGDLAANRDARIADRKKKADDEAAAKKKAEKDKHMGTNPMMAKLGLKAPVAAPQLSAPGAKAAPLPSSQKAPSAAHKAPSAAPAKAAKPKRRRSACAEAHLTGCLYARRACSRFQEGRIVGR
ncbi:hypothetical protein MMC13_005599 [Lambiella insularis]|nr:hypothetical protein [Lambiella insularis]